MMGMKAPVGPDITQPPPGWTDAWQYTSGAGRGGAAPRPSANGDGAHEDKEHGALARWRPWNERSMPLAVHFERHWQVRSDRFGAYYTDVDGKVRTTTPERVPLTQ